MLMRFNQLTTLILYDVSDLENQILFISKIETIRWTVNLLHVIYKFNLALDWRRRFWIRLTQVSVLRNILKWHLRKKFQKKVYTHTMFSPTPHHLAPPPQHPYHVTIPCLANLARDQAPTLRVINVKDWFFSQLPRPRAATRAGGAGGMPPPKRFSVNVFSRLRCQEAPQAIFFLNSTFLIEKIYNFAKNYSLILLLCPLKPKTFPQIYPLCPP